MVKDFRPVFDRSDGVLRFALLDKYVNGGTLSRALLRLRKLNALPAAKHRVGPGQPFSSIDRRMARTGRLA
jgi:hypothetical protein